MLFSFLDAMIATAGRETPFCSEWFGEDTQGEFVFGVRAGPQCRDRSLALRRADKFVHISDNEVKMGCIPVLSPPTFWCSKLLPARRTADQWPCIQRLRESSVSCSPCSFLLYSYSSSPGAPPQFSSRTTSVIFCVETAFTFDTGDTSTSAHNS